jgi:hypothetical protein
MRRGRGIRIGIAALAAGGDALGAVRDFQRALEKGPRTAKGH